MADFLESDFNTDIDAYLRAESEDTGEETSEETAEEIPSQEEETSEESDESEDGEESGEEEAESDTADGEDTSDSEGDKSAPPETPAIAKLKEELSSKPLKPVTIKAGDTNIDIPVDAKFEVKVDGEVKEVTTRELLDAFSSKQSNYNYYQKVQQEKQQVERSVAQYDAVIESFGKLVEEGKGIEAMAHLIEATGRDPLPIVRKIREQLASDAAAYVNLTPEQKKLLSSQEELDTLKRREARRLEQETAERQRSQLQQEVNRVVSNYALSGESEFIEWYRRAEAYVAPRKERGEIPKDFEITAEWVGQYAEASKKTQMMYEVLNEVAPQVRDDREQVEKIARLVATVKPSREELKTALREIYGSQTSVDQAVKDVNEKIRDQKRVSAPSVKPSRKTKVVMDDDDPGLDIDRTPNVKDWRKFIK